MKESFDLKGILIKLAVALSLVIGPYTAWVLYPPVRQPNLIQNRYAKAKAHYEQRVKLANSDENGYNKEPMGRYWRDSYSGDTATLISEWGLLALTWPTSLPDNDSSKRAREKFTALLPQIRDSIDSPIFSFALEPRRADLNTSPVSSAELLVTGLCYLAHLEIAEGRPEEGLDIVRSVLHFGSRLREQQNFDHSSVAAQCRVAYRLFLLKQLQTDKLNPEKWEELARLCWTHVPSVDHLERCQEDSMLAVLQFFEDVEAGKIPKRSAFGEEIYWYLPGVPAREERIYKNHMAMLFQGTLNSVQWARPGTREATIEWLLGKSSDLYFPYTAELGEILNSIEQIQMQGFGLLCQSKALNASGKETASALESMPQNFRKGWTFNASAKAWEHPIDDNFIYYWTQELDPVRKEAGIESIDENARVIRFKLETNS